MALRAGRVRTSHQAASADAPDLPGDPQLGSIIASDPVRVSPPAALPLSLAELRAQCRLTDDDGTDENALLMSYLRAATEYVEQYTGLALITQDFEQRFSSFPSELVLRPPPGPRGAEVTYRDTTDIDVAIASTVYRVLGSDLIDPRQSSACGYSQAVADHLRRCRSGAG